MPPPRLSTLKSKSSDLKCAVSETETSSSSDWSNYTLENLTFLPVQFNKCTGFSAWPHKGLYHFQITGVHGTRLPRNASKWRDFSIYATTIGVWIVTVCRFVLSSDTLTEWNFIKFYMSDDCLYLSWVCPILCIESDKLSRTIPPIIHSDIAAYPRGDKFIGF